MKPKIWIILGVFSLLLALLVGCVKAGPSTSPAPVSPSPAPSVSAPPSSNYSLPPNSSPSIISTPKTTNNPATSSSPLQSGLPLTVSEPADAATLTAGTVTVKGQTQAGATVSINDQVTVADNNGNFSIPINLDEGLDAIDVIATGANGEQGEVLLLVTVDLSSAASTPAAGNSP